MRSQKLILLIFVLLIGAGATAQVLTGGMSVTGGATMTVPDPVGPEFDVSLPGLSANNTAGCTTQAYCAAPFVAMQANPADSGVQTATPNPVPKNVSTVDIHTLAPANVKVLAHFMPWFKKTGSGDHTQTKYNSNDLITVAAQINDMIQRHYDGLVIDWYSSINSNSNGTTLKVRDNTAGRCSGAQNCPVLFAIMEDQGAIFHSSAHNCTSTNHTCIVNSWETDLCYMNANFFGSQSYMKINPSTHRFSSSGQPLVFTFPPSFGWSATDISTIKTYAQNLSANCPSSNGGGINNGAVLLVTENSSGFSSPYDGGFSWISPSTWSVATNCKVNPNNAIALGSQFCWDGSSGTYLSGFYSSGNAASTRATVGSGNKGFDDNNASWGTNRVKAQRCGQTWLNTFSRASSSSTITLLQVATWNDYEEGTEVETGIATCYGMNASITFGHIVNWSLTTTDSTYAPTGTQNGTIHHFEVYFGPVGGVMVNKAAGNVSAASSTLDLTPLSLPFGTWSVYVRLVSQPGIHNVLVGPVTYVH